MAEERRKISFYNPRIQVPLADVETDDDTYGLYCLPTQGAEMLVRIAPYLFREVTWINEVLDIKTFTGPTSTELGLIEEIVSETIEGLTMACDFSEITDRLDAQLTILAGLANCVCNQTGTAIQDVARLPPLDDYKDNGMVTINPPGISLGYYTDPFADGGKCEMAQAMYQYTYEMYTETLLPFARDSADTLCAVITAATWFSTLAGFLGIPIAILGTMVTATVNWGIDGSIADFTNWLWNAKYDICCIARRWLPNLPLVCSFLSSFIDEQETLSYLDKAVLKTVLCSEWHWSWVIKSQQEDGTWDASIISGFCSDCDDDVELYWTGSPCSTATLLGDCGTNDCRHAHSGGYVASPNFVLSADSHVVFAMRLENSAIAGSFQINIFNYSTSLSVFYQDVTLASNEDRWEFFETDLPGGTYNVRIHAVGGVDCDVFRLIGEAIPQA